MYVLKGLALARDSNTSTLLCRSQLLLSSETSPWGLQDILGFIAGSTTGPSVYLWWVLPYPGTCPTFTRVPYLPMYHIYSVDHLYGDVFKWHHDRKLRSTSEISLLDNLIHMLLNSADGSIIRNVSRRNFLLRSLWPLDDVFPYFFFLFLYSAIGSNFSSYLPVLVVPLSFAGFSNAGIQGTHSWRIFFGVC